MKIHAIWRSTLPAVALTALLSGCTAIHVRPAIDTPSAIRNQTGFSLPPDSASTLPPGVDLSKPLTSDDAAAIALWKNPQLQVDLAALGLARGDLIDAGLLRNPRVDLIIPAGLKPFELLLNFPVEVFLSRPFRVAASQAAYDQLAQNLVQNGLNTLRDARFAHADLVLAKEREIAGIAASELRKRIAQLTSRRLQAGDISELDEVAARSEEATAGELLVRLQHDTVIAAERLRILLGLSLDHPKIDVVTAPVAFASPPLPADLLEKALINRPDLRAAELGVVAATKRAKWEHSRILVLAGQLNSKGIGTNGILTSPGVSLELPIFNRNQGLIARADADVLAASKQYLNLKQRVAFEVYESRELLVQAQDALNRLRGQVIPPLQSAATLAGQQYEKGDVAYLFVLEQSRGLIDANLRLADTEAAVRRSQAQLERSVGTK